MNFTPKQIVSAVDFTPASELALRYAATLARIFSAPVTAATAERYEPPLEFTASQMNEVGAELDEALRNRRSELDLFARRQVPAEWLAGTQVIDQPLAEAMLQVIRQTGAGLAVLGVHEESTTRGFLVESLPLELVHRARIPVFTANAAAGARRPPETYEIRRILCAVNFNPASLDGLRLAAQLAAGQDVEVHVIYVIEPGVILEGFHSVQERLATLVAATVPGLKIKPLVGEGEIVPRLVHEAERLDADLIVAGPGKATWTDRIRRFRVAEELMRKTTVPVLLAPAGSGQ